MKSQLSRRRFLGTCALGLAVMFCNSSVGLSAGPRQGQSQLNVTIFKAPRVPARAASGAFIEIMNPNGAPRGLSCTTNHLGKCTINMPAVSDGSLAFYIRIRHGGRTSNHYYGKDRFGNDRLFPNQPGQRYNQSILVP
jgi:hypothetical protein